VPHIDFRKPTEYNFGKDKGAGLEPAPISELIRGEFMNPRNFNNLLNKTFTRLLVVGRAPNDKNGDTYWFCQCSCGSPVRRVKGYFLRSKKSRSCGCYQKEHASKFHSGAVGQAASTQCFNNYKHLARAREIVFDLSKEEFLKLTKGNCFYCGCEPYQIIEVPSGNGTYIYNGIDRLDSSKGYATDNCVPCCGTHNLMKLDTSKEDFIAACRAVVNHFDSQSPKKVGE
jgi:hypothetical protein